MEQTSQLINLSDFEIDEVNGGIIPVVLIWAAIEGASYGLAAYAAIQVIATT